MESKFVLSSPAFKNGDPLPLIYSNGDKNLSPPLQWKGAPADTKSYVLINDDPDAPTPTKNWNHWVVWNIPADCAELKEGAGIKGSKLTGFSAPVSQGITDFGYAGYGGPAPPSGTHRYFFKLYALKSSLKLASGSGKVKVETAMKELILAQAELMGTFTSKK